MTGRMPFRATLLMLLLLAGAASAQTYYMPVQPLVWWGNKDQGQPILCGYIASGPRRSPPEFFAYPPAVPTYNAVAYGPLANYPTYGPPGEGGTPARISTQPPSPRPHIFLEKVKDLLPTWRSDHSGPEP